VKEFKFGKRKIARSETQELHLLLLPEVIKNEKI